MIGLGFEINNKNPYIKKAKKFLNEIINSDKTHLFLRDDGSSERIYSYLGLKNLTSIPDPSKLWKIKQNLLFKIENRNKTSLKIGICIASDYNKGKSNYKRIKKYLIKLMIKIATSKNNIQLVLLSQTLQDIVFWMNIMSAIPKSNFEVIRQKIIIPSLDFSNPNIYLSYVIQCNRVYTQRFHTCILANKLNIQTFPIEGYSKLKSFKNFLSIESFFLHLNKFIN